MRDSSSSEFVIAVIQSDAPNQRMVFASRNSNCERPIVLRQESHSPDVGWFTQSSIFMTRQDMVQLRAVMGGRQHQACQATSQKLAAETTPAKILSFEALPAAS